MNKNSIFLKKTILIFAILLILFNLNTQATTVDCEEKDNFCYDQSSIVINLHTTLVSIINPKNIIVVDTYIFENNQSTPLSVLDFWLNQSYTNLKIEDDNGILSYINTTNLITINLRSNLNQNQTSIIVMSYKLNVELPFYSARKQSYYYFPFRSTISYFTEEHNLFVRLPSKCYLHEEEDVTDWFPYYPEDAKVSISIDDRISLGWVNEELLPSSNPFIFCFFEEPDTGIPLIWLIIVGPLLGLIIGAIGVFFFMKRKETKIYSELEKVYITDSQKILLSLIHNLDGKTTQKMLIERTGFSKSKISRNLTPLEEKDLITREKWGREYRVYLTPTGKKLIKKIVAKEFPDTFNETQTDFSKGEEQM